MDEQPTPTIPPLARTWLYVVGTFAGFASPVFIASDLTLAGGLAGALAGACTAVAFGYRPTR